MPRRAVPDLDHAAHATGPPVQRPLRPASRPLTCRLLGPPGYCQRLARGRLLRKILEEDLQLGLLFCHQVEAPTAGELRDRVPMLVDETLHHRRGLVVVEWMATGNRVVVQRRAELTNDLPTRDVARAHGST